MFNRKTRTIWLFPADAIPTTWPERGPHSLAGRAWREWWEITCHGKGSQWSFKQDSGMIQYAFKTFTLALRKINQKSRAPIRSPL